jgi:hypothetical protein
VGARDESAVGAGAVGVEGASRDDTGWTIVLLAFRSANQAQEAAAMLERVRGVPTLEGAYVTARGGATFIGLGRFADPGEGAAKAELSRVRGIELDGGRPFASSFFAPPERGPELGSRPEFSLTRAREQFGKDARYTFAVAVYGRVDVQRPTEEDLRESRAQAEAAVTELRRRGELAFYFHGPRQSIVSIGVFSDQDLRSGQRPESAGLAALRARYPVQAFNGAELKRNGIPVRSDLVAIPNN